MPTIVVRLWQPSAPTDSDHIVLRGVVDVVGAPRSRVFIGEHELIELLRSAVRGDANAVDEEPGSGVGSRGG